MLGIKRKYIIGGTLISSNRSGPFIPAGIDSQALEHFNRVISDGGTIPAGLAGCDAWFKAVKGVYGVSDITSAISCAYDPHYLGYKLGAGSGATLGSAAQTCYNAIGSTGDVVQTTAASQPLILPHTGTNYVWLPAISGNYFSTPNNTNNQLISNFSIEINANYDSSLTNVFIGKAASISSNASFYFFRDSSGFLRLVISTDGVNLLTYISTASTSLPFLRISRNSTTGIIKFFTSTDGVTYTQLGADVAGVTGNIFNSTSNLEIGSVFGGGSSMRGIINSVKIYKDDSFTTPTQIFNPASYSASTSQTQWTSSTGEVWSINMGTTTTGYKVAIVDRSILMSDGVDDKLISSSLSFTAPTYMQVVTRVFPTSPGTTAICGGNNLNYYTQDGGLRRSVKDGNLQGDASGYTARILCLEGLQISRTANQFIFSRNDSTTLTTSIGGAPITDSSVISMFANLAGNLPSNCSVNSLVFSTYPSTTQRTSFYNVLRAFNNNAF